MKPCTKCGIEKTFSEYYVKDSNSGRLHAHCKLCYKEHRKSYHFLHYATYGDHYRERARIYRNKIKAEYRENIRKYMDDKSCIDCGEADYVVLELDHIDPKSKLFSISQAVKLGYKWSEVIKELEKCQVLCANCHKRRTAVQFGWNKI